MGLLQRILVPLDGSTLAESALPVAAHLARVAAGSLYLVRVVPNAEVRNTEADVTGDVDGKAEAYLEAIRERLSDNTVSVEGVVAHGEPAGAIIEEAVSRGAGLIAMATHGRSGLGRFVYGSVAEAVFLRSPVPVVLTRAWRPDGGWRPPVGAPRILLPLDGSTLAESALPVARDLARPLGATLELVRAYQLPPLVLGSPASVGAAEVVTILQVERAEADRYVEGKAQQLRDEGFAVETRVDHGWPALVIADEETDPRTDLIVMATHGRGGLKRTIFGSVTDAVVRQGSRPVVVVRPEPAAAR